MSDDAITFRTRGDGTASLEPTESVRRLLLHVLPRGFVKMRHYGLLAPGNVNTKLTQARRLLADQPDVACARKMRRLARRRSNGCC